MPATAALVGADMPEVRPGYAIAAGNEVRAGDLLFSDRRRPELRFVAPVSGRIEEIVPGPRRSLDRLVIRLTDAEARPMALPERADRQAIVALMIEAGLWTALRSRPFEHVPPPDAQPDALFVTAMDTRPLAPDPAAIVAKRAEWFARGLNAVRLLCTGRTYLCHAAGADLPGAEGIRAVGFWGPHPAGLAGSHIRRLHPVGQRGTAWHIGYQDVIALGHLLATGRPWTRRVIALAGDGAREPAVLETVPGADLHELCRGRLAEGPVRLLSGSPIDGRPARHLGRRHLQVTALRGGSTGGQASPAGRALDWLRRGSGAIIPNAAHERAAPAGILPIPLLRALSAGDTETARRLGALELAEEDLALLSHVDGTGTDFGALLRRTLDALEAAR